MRVENAKVDRIKFFCILKSQTLSFRRLKHFIHIAKRFQVNNGIQLHVGNRSNYTFTDDGNNNNRNSIL